MITAMDLVVFLKGILIGICVAGPVGPISLLCVKRTLQRGKISGLLTGLGASLADSVYGWIAAFGISAVSQVFLEQRFWFRFIGCLLLAYVGFRTFKTEPVLKTNPSRLEEIAGTFASSFLLTLSNPITIVVFGALFLEFGLQHTHQTTFASCLMVLGVFLGSSAWWLTLCSLVERFGSHITPQTLHKVNRISGAVILIFAAVGLIRLAQGILMSHP